MVSDASKQEAKGTFVWAMADYNDIYCSNTGIVSGCVDSITSYRAKAFEVLSLVTFLWRTLHKYLEREEKMNVTIHCDNELVIKTTASMADVDVDCNFSADATYSSRAPTLHGGQLPSCQGPSDTQRGLSLRSTTESLV